jgi:hypothetical protein
VLFSVELDPRLQVKLLLKRMRCPRCDAFSPDDKKFCADCGQDLNAAPEITRAYIDERIDSVIKSKLADQDLVEIGLTAAIAERIVGWGKLIVYFAGIPIAILVIILGILGLKQYSDIRKLAQTAKDTVKPIVDQAVNEDRETEQKAKTAAEGTEALEQRSKALAGTLTDLEPKVAKIRSEAGRLAGIEAQVSTIQVDVNQLKEEVRPSIFRTDIKYRQPDSKTVPQDVTIDYLFKWPHISIPPILLMRRNAPVDPRENLVLEITGDLFAAEVDKETGTVRVLISESLSSVQRTIILAVPDVQTVTKAGVDEKGRAAYARAQSDLLAILSEKKSDLPDGPKWKILQDFKGPRRVTAIGFAQYNNTYDKRTAGGAKIGAWQLSPVWQIER